MEGLRTRLGHRQSRRGERGRQARSWGDRRELDDLGAAVVWVCVIDENKQFDGQLLVR